MTEKKKPEIVFVPGCFDNVDFESQEELDEFVANITAMFADGSFLENSRPVDMKELQDTDPELYARLVNLDNDDKRQLQ
jgi:hypothetical protein